MSMFNKLRQLHHSNRDKRQSGQGYVEYALILILVGIVIIVIVNVMEDRIAEIFSELANDSPVAPPSLMAFDAPPTATPHPDVTLSVSTTGNGGWAAVPNQAQYAYGSEITLEAIPDSGWAFVGWEGDLTGQTNPANLLMDSDKVITAKFANAIYSVSVTIVGGSALNAVDLVPEGPYALGQQVTLTANPDSDNGWAFSNWSGDFSSTENPYVLTVAGNTAVTATFDDSTYTLTTNAVGEGTGSILRDPDLGAYAEGMNVTLRAVASPGSYFVGWSGDLSGDGNPQTLTMNSNKTVTAVFELAPVGNHTLSIITNPVSGGTVTANPDKTSYNDGETVVLEAVANPGWTFSGWSGDLSGSVTPTTITMNADKTVTATFTQLAYTLNIATNGNGTVTKNPDRTTYTYGEVVTVNAVPDPGWEFASWSGDLTGTTNPTTITMDGNKTATATFSELACSLTLPWQSRDIGGVATAGEACEEGSVYTVRGSGADIWGTDDEFHYMYQTFSGNGEIIARVNSQVNTNSWAKAGLMIRESLNADSKHAFAAVTPANGIRLQYRPSTGSTSSDISGPGSSPPIWLKLERIGDSLTAYYSSDGSNWTQYASTSISMNTNLYFGVAVTSHSDGNLSTALFTNITINSLAAPTYEVYLSSESGGSIDGVSYENEDILKYDGGTDTWSMYLDMSDVGILDDIDAFTFNGNIVYMSFANGLNVPGVGTVEDADIVSFQPTSTGNSTAGSFAMYFDGGDVSLSRSGENIDALALLADNDIVMSTSGDFNVSGASGKDEDLFQFTPNQLGWGTSGSFSMYLDSADSGGFSEDLGAVWINNGTGRIFMAIKGNDTIGGVSVTPSDVFVCTPVSLGTSSECNFDGELFFDGSVQGFNQTIDGLYIVQP